MARIEEREIGANGLRFEALASGPADGEAVILLHGYPQSASSWRGTAGWLADQGYRVVAPSLRGYSPGANPPDAASYAMSVLVADVIGIADAEGIDRFHLVGHDWGGALAWMVAGAHPGRLLSLTVISTPHPAAMRMALTSSTQALRSSYMGFFRLPRVPELVLQAGNFAQMGFGCRVSGLPKKAWLRDRAHLRRIGGLRGPLNWYRGTATAMGKPRRITVPTMYIWGRHDLFLGRTAARLTAKFVTGPYRFVDLDAGHWIADRNPGDLYRLLGENLAANAPAPLARAGDATTPARRPRRAAPARAGHGGDGGRSPRRRGSKRQGDAGSQS
jgi:pimeloyl-ACP methyl ester carboxylesterase